MSLRTSLMLLAVFLADQFTSQEPYFPDLIFLPKNKEVNSIIDDMTSVHLRAMKEPSLWKLSAKDRTATVYRFLWLASSEHPISIRLSRSDKQYALHIARHDSPPGITAGKLTVNKDLKLTAQHGERLVKFLEKTAFWTAPVEVKEIRGIADGDRIVIEGVMGGKYHVISRAGSAAGESYKAFCRSLIELSSETEVLKAWDRYRLEERNSPDYVAEPPQTEDLGDFKPADDAP